MNDTDWVRVLVCLAFACVVLWKFYFLNKGKHRYQPIIDPWMLLGFLAIFPPAFLLMLKWEDTLPTLSSFLFTIFIQAMLYYMVLLLVLPLLRRWFSAEAVSALWVLPSFLYLLSQSFMKRSRPLVLWFVNAGFIKPLAVIWAVGAVLVLLYFTIQHLLFSKQLLNNSVPVTDPAVLDQWKSLQNEILFYKDSNLPLMSSPNLASPLSIGLTRYTIRVVLPNREYTPEERALIFRHELIHIAHGDSALKLMLVLCTALCWFNPLLWLAMKRCAQDAELSCDQQVMEDCGQEQGQRYAKLILSSAGEERGFTTCLSADAKSLRYRLRGIVNPGKRWRGGFLVALAMFFLLYTSGSISLAWRCGTVQEQIFDSLPPDFALTSVLWDSTESGEITSENYSCTDDEALTRYLAGLELYQSYDLYDFQDENQLYLTYRRPDELTYLIMLGEQDLTVSYLSCENGYRNNRVKYILAQPTDWTQLFRWLEPKQK